MSFHFLAAFRTKRGYSPSFCFFCFCFFGLGHSFIEVGFRLRMTHSFKVCDSVVFGVLPGVCCHRRGRFRLFSSWPPRPGSRERRPLCSPPGPWVPGGWNSVVPPQPWPAPALPSCVPGWPRLTLCCLFSAFVTEDAASDACPAPGHGSSPWLHSAATGNTSLSAFLSSGVSFS